MRTTLAKSFSLYLYYLSALTCLASILTLNYIYDYFVVVIIYVPTYTIYIVEVNNFDCAIYVLVAHFQTKAKFHAVREYIDVNLIYNRQRKECRRKLVWKLPYHWPNDEYLDLEIFYLIFIIFAKEVCLKMSINVQYSYSYYYKIENMRI